MGMAYSMNVGEEECMLNNDGKARRKVTAMKTKM
jgi:hypothetical protein